MCVNYLNDNHVCIYTSLVFLSIAYCWDKKNNWENNTRNKKKKNAWPLIIILFLQIFLFLVCLFFYFNHPKYDWQRCVQWFKDSAGVFIQLNWCSESRIEPDELFRLCERRIEVKRMRQGDKNKREFLPIFFFNSLILIPTVSSSSCICIKTRPHRAPFWLHFSLDKEMETSIVQTQTRKKKNK